MWVETFWYGGGIYEMFPASLETLRFYIDNDWSINKWGLGFFEFV
jgi:hypothetical protein